MNSTRQLSTEEALPGTRAIPRFRPRRNRKIVCSYKMMSANDTVRENGQSWESVHVCPNCGHVINLAGLDLRAITTGIVNCPSCDWSGQIEIQVIDQVPRKKPASAE